MTLAALACFAIAGALAIWLLMVWKGLTQDWLPLELKGAKLVNIEEDLAIDLPYPVVGRPDQVYQLSDGLHVPVELKNRDHVRIYKTDIAEISLRAWLLRMNGKQTASFGFMAINSRGNRKRKTIKVELRNDVFCERLIERYIALIEGTDYPHRSEGAKCKTCSHKLRCNNTGTSTLRR